jgi:hypothetical protein
LDIATIRLSVQIATFAILLIGLWLTLRQLRLLRKSYVDQHEWNRRKAAQDAIENTQKAIGEDTFLLDAKFKIMTSYDTIPRTQILDECDADPKVRIAIHRRLNTFEILALGVKKGVYDEDVLKAAYKEVFRRTLNRFREYIEQRRNLETDLLWAQFEKLTQDWGQQASPPLGKTGTP